MVKQVVRKLRKVTPPPFSGSYDIQPGNILLVPNSSDFAPGTGDFTVETFVKLSQMSLNPRFIGNSYWNGNRCQLAIGVIGGNAKVLIGDNGFRTDATFGSLDLNNYLNQWFHIAAVRKSGVVNLYVDGQPLGTAENNNSNITLDPTLFFGIGGESQSGDTVDSATATPGLYSNIRWTNSAVYDGAFTVPTSALQALPETVLLINAYDRYFLKDFSKEGNDPYPATNSTIGYSPETPFN